MSSPLADKIRPGALSEVVGQHHLLDDGKPLSGIIRSGIVPNMIFYGPPGTGKTTVARIIASSTNKKLYKLNGTNASTSDIREIVSHIGTLEAYNGILLYLDEIQYFNKKQQQSLLEYIENGDITLIASTTENPYFYVYGALLSRSTVFEFKSVEPQDVLLAVKHAFSYMGAELNCVIKLEDGVENHIAHGCGGDVRKAINTVEFLCYSSRVTDEGRTRTVSLEDAKQLTQKSAVKYDKEGDEHYDLLSAFQKSMRGSDPDAAIHYLARILSSGDLPSACRRLAVCACEDVGLADPRIIPIVKSCIDIALMVGLPEARIPLADAVLLVCSSPKSNSAYKAINSAMRDIESGKTGPIPRNLQNMHYDGADAKIRGQFYIYPHDYENHWIRQQYLPDNLADVTYYEYGNNKNEQAAREYWSRIKGEKK